MGKAAVRSRAAVAPGGGGPRRTGGILPFGNMLKAKEKVINPGL